MATERRYGHTLNKDLLDQFLDVLRERPATIESEVEKKLCSGRLEKLDKNAKYRETQINALLAKTGARSLKSHQATLLSALEE